MPGFPEVGDRTAVRGRPGRASAETRGVGSLSACRTVRAELGVLPVRFSEERSTPMVRLEEAEALGVR